MFLTRLIRVSRRDDGVAMAAVLGLLAVGLILTSVILASVVSASGYSRYTRAGVQAQSAAEAGIAAARAGLTAGTCSGSTPTYRSANGDVPAYAATIWRPDGSGGWVQGCPVGTGTQVRILSTGYSEAPGSTGFSAANSTVLEAILAASSTPISITASGPAIYAYSASSFGGSGSLVSVDGSVPDVLVKTGNVTCNGDATGVANFVVNGGSLAVQGSCKISGNAFASGRMTFEGSGYVQGFVVANGVTMSGSSRIYQRVWSASDISLSGNPTVSGIVKAYSASLDGGTFSAAAYIYGNTNVKNAGGTTLNGTLTTQTATPTPPDWWGGNSKISRVNPITAPTFNSDLPATPVVPNWVDFGSRAEDFTTTVWNGFTIYTMGTTCNETTLRAAITAIGSAPGVIDGRACSGRFGIGGDNNIQITNDLAIITNNFRIDGSGRFSSTTSKRLWLINPDTVANGVPDCPGSLEITGGGTKFTNISTMIYSGCKVVIGSGITVTGQVFGADVSMSGSATLRYTAVGLPGVNLSTGTTTPTGSSTASRSVLSLRNVAG